MYVEGLPAYTELVGKFVLFYAESVGAAVFALLVESF